MEVTIQELIDKLLRVCDGDTTMVIKGIRQINTPHEKGTIFHHHNIGIELIDDEDFFGNPIKVVEIVSGGNNVLV